MSESYRAEVDRTIIGRWDDIHEWVELSLAVVFPFVPYIGLRFWTESCPEELDDAAQLFLMKIVDLDFDTRTQLFELRVDEDREELPCEFDFIAALSIFEGGKWRVSCTSKGASGFLDKAMVLAKESREKQTAEEGTDGTTDSFE